MSILSWLWELAILSMLYVCITADKSSEELFQFSTYSFHLFETSTFIEFKFSRIFLTTLSYSLMRHQLLSISSVQCRLWHYNQKRAKIWTALCRQISWICAETKKFFRGFTACKYIRVYVQYYVAYFGLIQMPKTWIGEFEDDMFTRVMVRPG